MSEDTKNAVEEGLKIILKRMEEIEPKDQENKKKLLDVTTSLDVMIAQLMWLG